MAVTNIRSRGAAARALIAPTAHAIVRNGRRVKGRAQLNGISVTGSAPNAVIRALKAAAVGVPSVEEKAWITRIELMRSLMGRSPQVLEIVDFGAGVGHEFDNGESDLKHTTERTLAQMTRSSKPPQWAYLLFRLVRELRTETAIELGACVGISAAYMTAAMELNGRGRLVTLEGSDVLAIRSARTLEELQLNLRAEVREGRFADTLEQAITDFTPVGLAFIDGHHVESATVDYMNAILPSAADEAILIFDDINWSDGMRRAWDAVVADERFALTVDLRSVGLAIVSKSATNRQSLTVSYY
jgi:predicted O-methyltransferase YrrM